MGEIGEAISTGLLWGLVIGACVVIGMFANRA